MIKIRSRIYFLLKKLKVLALKDFIVKKYAKYNLRRNCKTIKGNGVMRVAFIVYEPGMWDKQEPVYEEMLKREGIEPYLIVVPDVSVSKEVRLKKQEFFSHRYKNVIIYDENTIESFKNGEFHYTFYQTPYNYKYPKKVRPVKLVKYSKLCFIPYAYIGAKEFFEVSSHENFFCNIYFGFMDSEPMQELLHSKFRTECEKGYQNFEFLGYPAFESYVNMKVGSQIKNVLWIPRWSYAEKGGGSHFLEYKDNYNHLAMQHTDLSWMMRPHPLMFTSLANQGLFSHEQAEEYRKSLLESNVYIDEHSLLSETLNATDLLIADYSSIIVMYFLSGHPIIYCDGNLDLSGIYQQLYSVMYIAKTWDEVESLTKDIINGIDPLKEERQKVSALIAEKHKDASKRIVDKMYEDFSF